MDLSKEIRSLSDFKRNQDAASYGRLLESVDYSDAIKGIRRGMDDITHGRFKPAALAFSEIRKKHAIPRKSRP